MNEKITILQQQKMLKCLLTTLESPSTLRLQPATLRGTLIVVVLIKTRDIHDEVADTDDKDKGEQ